MAEIDEGDYFLKSTELKVWLDEVKRKVSFSFPVRCGVFLMADVGRDWISCRGMMLEGEGILSEVARPVAQFGPL